MTFRVQLLSLLALMAMAWTEPAANAATSFSLVDPQLTLAPGKLEGRSSMLLSIAGASEEEIASKPENIVDLRVDDSVQGAVSFTPTLLFGSTKERKWLLTGEIKDLPLDTVQKRYLKFSFGGQDVALAYAVSNKGTSNTPFSWTVNLPSGEVSLPEGQPVQLTISVGSLPATKLRFAQPLFVEQSRREPVRGGWLFCDQESATPSSKDCPADDRTIQANTTRTFWAYPPTPLVGKFVGSFSLFAAEKPAGETFPLTFLSTTCRKQLIGIAILAAGVLLAWLAMVLVQRRASHDQLLLPALEIDDHVQQLQTALGKAPSSLAGETKKTANTLAELSKNLKPSRLESWGIPYLVPRLGGQSASIQDYQSRIVSFAKRADALDVIIAKGLKRAWDAYPTAQVAGKEKAVRHAARGIDELSPDPALDPAKAFQDCLAILKVMDTALATGGNSPGFADVDAARAVERVRAEIRTLSLLAWVFFGIVSVVIGSYILVLNNPSFGTTTDLVLCALWGFGLPVGGSQLSQLSVSNLAGVMGFQLSKTT